LYEVSRTITIKAVNPPVNTTAPARTDLIAEI